MDNKETIKERLKILPEKLKAFVIDEKWRNDVENTSKQFNLDEEKYISLENEIFLVLLCFEPIGDFVENIKRELEIDKNVAGWIEDYVNKNIFSKIKDEIDFMWQSENQEESEKENQIKNSIGESFEQIILNQAKAMKEAVPENLPTEDVEEKPKAIHNYLTGQDPYREPIE